MKKNEFSIQNFLNIQEIIRMIDQKSNVLLVIYGIVLSLFVSVIEETSFVNLNAFDYILLKSKAILLFIFAIVIIVLLNIQVYILLFKVLKPRTANHYENGSNSLFYYKHISEMKKEDFIKAMSNVSEFDLDKAVQEQIYEISKIASEKQKHYNHLAFMLFVTLTCLFFYILVLKI